MNARDRLIVALDVPQKDAARALVERLSGHVGLFKVGSQIFTAVVVPNLNRYFVQVLGMASKGEWEASVALFLEILQSGEYTQ